jgi:hypothetical protein
VQQIIDSTLAIPAFVPATVCTGYVTAWFTNLYDFRRRSLIERIFWSLPLSLSVSTIASVLIGKFISLTAVVVFLVMGAALWVATLAWEWRQIRRTGEKWNIGWSPLGGKALLLAILWIVVVVLSLVDFQSDHKLYMNVALFDQSSRVNWTESVLRTGVPPANPYYWYKHSAPMRNYYFWYVLCAAVAQMAHLRARGVFNASSVWAGFVLAALIGLYLKHFLQSGVRLRKQFLCCIALLVVTGLDICVVLWNLLYFHRPPPADLEAWSKDGIVSWFHTLLWAPHHVVGMVCCMLAFLLAWMSSNAGMGGRIFSVLLIGAALASAFGLSIFVTFAFFLVMLVWALWQLAVERRARPALVLATGGAAALLLLLPYLSELTPNLSALAHPSPGMGGGSVFSFAVREMIPPDSITASHFLKHFEAGHHLATLNFAKLILLVPGYALELGYFAAVFLIYLIPACRGRTPLNSAQRSLILIVVATLPFISLIRSGVLKTNDFGWRGALFLQFPLLLLASEVMTSWNLSDTKQSVPTDSAGLLGTTPRWLRSVASFALIIGIVSTLCQGLMLRFLIPIGEAHQSAANQPDAHSFPHYAYLSNIGYRALNASIPRDAVVQYNVNSSLPYWTVPDRIGIQHQSAIFSDQLWCGSELGGDPSGCPTIAAAIDALYNSSTAEQARTTCRQYGIQYLVARISDPAWKDRSGWVWTLEPVVTDEEFRVLQCNHSF